MLQDILDYYRFESEIKVYPGYTKLENEMIREKMEKFWNILISSAYGKTILELTGCFYHKDNKGVTCFQKKVAEKESILIDYPSDRNIPFSQDNNTLIVCLPYYLFINEAITEELKKKKLKNNIPALYSHLRRLKKLNFIWHKPFIAGKDIHHEITKKKKEYKKQFGHGDTYQQLYCLLKFKSLLHLPENELSDLADSFNVTIDEWARDILRQDIIKHATKSAVTAIMSRNISHNIGSHVINYWNSHLEKHLPPDRNSWGTIDDFPNLIYQSRNLLAYVQQRMDFLANIPTSIPSSEYSLDFKTEIYEPIFGKDDSTIGYRNLEALISNITRSEGIQMDVNNFELKIATNNDNRYVSIPNGLTGRHAIYSILENFIRNTAKHYRGKDTNYSIQIVLKEPEDREDPKLWKQYYELNIWDMRENSCNEKIYKAFKEYLPGGSKSRYIDENAEINPDGWGFKEMYASANFLRKESPHKLKQVEKSNPPLIDVLCNAECKNDKSACKHEKGYEGKLGLRLFLRRPKDLLILSKSKKNNSRILGIEDSHEAGLNIDDEIPHRMLLVDNKKTMNSEKYPNLPCRIVEATESTLSDNVYLDLYNKFIGELLGHPGNLPRIYLDNVESKYQFKQLTGKIYVASNRADAKILFYRHLDTTSDFKNIMNKDYVQPLSGGLSTWNKLINRPSNDLLLEHFYMELIEAAITNVIIIDERVSEWQKRPFRSGISIKKILNKMNIFAVDIDLYQLKKIKRKIEDTFKEINGKPLHFLVIHQGILDKLNNPKDVLEDIMKQCRWKVVDSGRGVPHGLMEEARFIEISALLQSLYNYDKHGLVQTLFASRHPRSSEGGE